MTGTSVSFIPFAKVTLQRMGIDAVRLELLNELRAAGREMKKDLEGAVATWSNKPEVRMDVHLTRVGPHASIDVYIDDKRAEYLDKGTSGHYVRPRKKRAMKWGRTYRRKTRPNTLASTGGGHSGAPLFSKGHFVRGIQPRNFSATLYRRWERKVSSRLQAAIVRGAAKAG